MDIFLKRYVIVLLLKTSWEAKFVSGCRCSIYTHRNSFSRLPIPAIYWLHVTGNRNYYMFSLLSKKIQSSFLKSGIYKEEHYIVKKGGTYKSGYRTIEQNKGRDMSKRRKSWIDNETYDWILFYCECSSCTQTKDILFLFLQIPFSFALGLGNTGPPMASWQSSFREKIANRIICHDEEKGCRIYFQEIWLWYYSELSKGKWTSVMYGMIYLTVMIWYKHCRDYIVLFTILSAWLYLFYLYLSALLIMLPIILFVLNFYW